MLHYDFAYLQFAASTIHFKHFIVQIDSDNYSIDQSLVFIQFGILRISIIRISIFYFIASFLLHDYLISLCASLFFSFHEISNLDLNSTFVFSITRILSNE